MTKKAKDPRCRFKRTNWVKWPDATEEEVRCRLARGHEGAHDCAVDERARGEP